MKKRRFSILFVLVILLAQTAIAKIPMNSVDSDSVTNQVNDSFIQPTVIPPAPAGGFENIQENFQKGKEK